MVKRLSFVVASIAVGLPLPAKAVTVINIQARLTGTDVTECLITEPCDVGAPAIGTVRNFTLTFSENAPLDGTIGGFGEASGFTAGTLIYANTEFSRRLPTAGGGFIEGSNDICGSAGSFRFAGRRVSVTDSYCGYIEGPYPMIDVTYTGRVVSVFVNGTMVPEPSSWALMILGFGAVGGALRRHRAPKVTFGFY